MASQTDVYNRALQKLGLRSLTSPSDTTPRADACNRAYPTARRALYQSHTWNCSVKRAQLPADVTAPLFGRANYFSLPADYIRLLPLDPDDNSEDFDYQVEGRKLVSDEAGPLPLRYVADITDVNTMDPLFVEALACKMAVDMVAELTESNVKKQDLKEDLKAALIEARRANALVNRPSQPAPDYWETVRR